MLRAFQLRELQKREREKRDYEYALNLQSEFDKAAEQFQLQQKTNEVTLEGAIKELEKFRDNEGIQSVIADLKKVTDVSSADKARETINVIAKKYAQTTRLSKAIQTVQLALAQEFPANLEQGCILSSVDITTANIKSGKQVVTLDDGNAFDLKAFVDYHNQRAAGENCDEKAKNEEVNSPGKCLINPYNRKPYSQAAVTHIFAAIQKYNQDKKPSDKLKLYNVRGVNAGDLSPKEKQAAAERERKVAEQEQLLRAISQRRSVHQYPPASYGRPHQPSANRPSRRDGHFNHFFVPPSQGRRAQIENAVPLIFITFSSVNELGLIAMMVQLNALLQMREVQQAQQDNLSTFNTFRYGRY